MGALGLLFLILGEPIMRLFTTDPTVIALGAAGLRPMALAQPFWAVLFVQAGALRGAGNTQYPMRVNTAGIWTAVLLGALLVQVVGGSLAIVWSAFLLTAPVTSMLLWRRFRRAITRERLGIAF
jgi:Na+-driven multidrug efflux pump